MILQALGLKSQPQTGNGAVNAAAAAQLDSTANEPAAELQLERDLAIVLARRPKATSDHQNFEDLVDDEIAFIGSEELSDTALEAGSLEDEDANAEPAPSQGPAHLDETLVGVQARGQKLSPKETRDRWLKSSKRSRRSVMFRTAASFAITIFVTAFIVSIVAAILFGLPEGLDKFNLSTANATTEIATTATSETAAPTEVAVESSDEGLPPPRLQWISTQGK